MSIIYLFSFSHFLAIRMPCDVTLDPGCVQVVFQCVVNRWDCLVRVHFKYSICVGATGTPWVAAASPQQNCPVSSSNYFTILTGILIIVNGVYRVLIQIICTELILFTQPISIANVDSKIGKQTFLVKIL